MAKHFYLSKEHWAIIVKGVYEQSGHHGRPTGAIGKLWTIICEADRLKRVVFEIEIRD